MRARPPTWKPHPVLGWALRALLAALPLALSVFVTTGLARLVDRPEAIGHALGWWAFIFTAGAAVVYTTDLLVQRLLPLVALLRLSLAFPDRAPARFGVALRTGTPRQLQRRMADARRDGLGDTPQEAAETLLTLVAALSVHDRLTRGHCERVRAYTDLIAKEMGLSPTEISKIHWAAMIHDIGKLEVPTEILSKAGRLTDDEFAVIKGHPEAGARLAAPLAEWLGEWFHAIDHHHERWDGGGYPYGLAGEEISMGGRIVAVADVFDVITAARSYKKPQPASQARAELVRCAGTQFDPAVVRAFFAISSGRLRVMLGPLAWLRELPHVGQVSLAPATGAAGAAASTVMAAATAAVVGGLLLPVPLDAEVRTPSPVVVPSATPVREARAPAAGPPPYPDTPTAPVGPGPDQPLAAPVATTSPPARAGATALPTTTTTTSPTTPTTAPSTTTTAPPTTAPAVGSPVSSPPSSAPPPAPPQAADTSLAIQSGDDANVPLAALGSWPPGTQARVVQAPRHGTARLAADGLHYTPDAGFVGTDRIEFELCNSGGCSPAAVSVTVRARPLTAVDDDVDVDEDGTATVAVLANDDGGRGTLTITSTGSAALGDVVIVGDELRYTPRADVHGDDAVTYVVADQDGTTATGTLWVQILPVNDAPDATDDAATTGEDGPVVIDVLANDVDRDGDELLLQTVDRTGLLGAVTSSVDGRLTYTPVADFHGVEHFTYTVADPSGATATATVTVTVTPVNDAPTFTLGADPSSLEDDGPQTVAGWLRDLSPGPADESAQAVTVVVEVDDPDMFATVPAVTADGALTYTTADNHHGTVSLTVTVTDAGGATTTATATLTVTSVNDLPVVQDELFATPQDTPLAVSAAEGLLANDHDADGDPLVVTAVSAAVGEVVWAPDGSFTYTPAPGATASDSLTYTVSDGHGGTATGTATVAITAVPITTDTWYLRPGAADSASWQLGPPPTDTSIADYDGDGRAGLTIEKSSGNLDETNVARFQNFDLAPASDLVLDGAVTVRLAASVEGLLAKKAHLHLYLQDYAADGSSCILLAATDVHVDAWSGLLATWNTRSFSLGAVHHVVVPGRVLRLKVMNDHNDLWIAMSADHASRLELTLG